MSLFRVNDLTILGLAVVLFHVETFKQTVNAELKSNVNIKNTNSLLNKCSLSEY